MSDIIATRVHRILDARSRQLINNILAWKGGKPYIEARLHRAPNESDTSWGGDEAGTVPGRIDRAHFINDAGRIVQKIDQYLFAKDSKREGVDREWAQNVTKTGLSVRQYWQSVNEYFTTSQWVWCSVDRGAPEIDPETGRPRAKSIAQKQAEGDDVYWSLWASNSVVDWAFDDNGKLLWLLTEAAKYANADPTAVATLSKIRTLWKADPIACTWTQYTTDDKGETVAGESGSISIPDVPFVCVGVPSLDPWWFDEVELIVCALLNLTSLNHENLVKTVYPQLVIPETMVESLTAKVEETYGTNDGASIMETVRELIRGLDRPFVESAEDSGLTRYLQPNAADLKAIPEHQDRLRRQLFDTVGLALFNRETRAVQSAESKQFDHLDTEATLRNRALLLQEAERKLVALSLAIDPTFSDYEPVWPQDFNVPNTAENINSVMQIANVAELPPTMNKQLVETTLQMLDEISHITPERRETIVAEIEAMATDGSAGIGGEIGKIPLAIQQLALARERAGAIGDTDTANKLRDKMDELLAKIN